MLIARYKYSGGSFEGIGEIFGCDTFNDYPSTYPPNLQYEPSIHNNDPNVYVTHETTGVRFYNSAVFKDVANNRAYVILISNPTMYYYSHSYAEGRTDSYNGRGPTNRVYNDYSTGYAKSMDLSSSDNLATFESDLPIFTNYQDYYDYATSLHEPPDQNRSGGAGSGYIGNSILSNKKMVGYNVPTSSAESTKTESVNEASENPVANKPKIGNGFARIKFLREGVIKTLEEVMEHPISQYDTLSVTNIYYFPYSSVDGDNAFWGGSDKRVLQYNASDGYYYYEFREANYDSADSAIAIAIPRQYIKNVTFKSGIFQTTSHPDCAFGFSPADTVTETGDNRFWCNYNHDSIQTINVPNVGTYYEFTVDVNGYADYLVFYGISGEWRMKDFELVVREE